MKTLSVIRVVFTLVGLGLVVGALTWGASVRAFVTRAEVAKGTVVGLSPSRSDGSTTYAPIVDFVTPEGKQVEFRHSVSSRPPSYSTGEQVEVLYLPDRPEKARIRGVFSLWGGPLILGGIGLIFASIGGGMTLAHVLKVRKDAELRQTGMPVLTTFQTVRLNSALRVNGRHPFQVVTQWLNPATGEVHVFHSENLWFDPAPYIRERQITVFLDRTNLKRYSFDLSFLPKQAD